jgi:hypothetical protein
MKQAELKRTKQKAWWGSAVLMAALFGFLSGCQKSDVVPQVSMGPTRFASPESAGQAVYKAAKAQDTNAVLAIFGQDGKEYLLTEDPNEDKSALDAFSEDYEHMHRWSTADDGELVLNIGVENYPFPFPLVKTGDGQWMYDSQRAKKEILARQIGDNELTVIDVLNEMADAQTEYFATTHDGSKVKQYAQRFVSSEGKHNGLFWKASEGEPESPLGPMSARADAEGYQRGTKESPQPFHGYFYRILKEQGPHAEGGAKSYIVNGNMTKGFAILGYPADYRKSGVMTFVIARDGRVYQKDLGPNTVESARATVIFDPDDSWSIVE